MGDVHAGHAPEGLLDHTDPWGTLGAHVVEAKGARGARVGEDVTVVSLMYLNIKFARAVGACASRMRASLLVLTATLACAHGKRGGSRQRNRRADAVAVSYTHLTLPTIAKV